MQLACAFGLLCLTWVGRRSLLGTGCRQEQACLTWVGRRLRLGTGCRQGINWVGHPCVVLQRAFGNRILPDDVLGCSRINGEHQGTPLALPNGVDLALGATLAVLILLEVPLIAVLAVLIILGLTLLEVLDLLDFVLHDFLLLFRLLLILCHLDQITHIYLHDAQLLVVILLIVRLQDSEAFQQ